MRTIVVIGAALLAASCSDQPSENGRYEIFVGEVGGAYLLDTRTGVVYERKIGTGGAISWEALVEPVKQPVQTPN